MIIESWQDAINNDIDLLDLAASAGVDIKYPDWIEADITATDIDAICYGGCASGAYMPAVTYIDAQETMQAHGDAILQYIEDTFGELPAPPSGESWSGRAVFFVSVAVELWAGGVMSIMECETFDLKEDD